MHKNDLPSASVPYQLDAGAGNRFAFGSQLATRICTRKQLGQAASGTILTGAKGARFPVHVHAMTHEALFVLEGVVKLVLGSEAYLLTPSDYVNIPAGTPHGYEFVDHRGKLLSWTFTGNAADAYERLGTRYSGVVYPEGDASVDWNVLDEGVDFALVRGHRAEDSGTKATEAPAGPVPFVLAASEGERMLAGDQLYTILGNQTHSNGVFIALLTEGPVGPAIPKHQHEKVTELFHCLNGEMEMYAGDEYTTLYPGDFLHIPPRTPHSFQLKKPDTRFLGFVLPGVFEPFFRYLCEPFKGYRYPLVPPPFRFDRVIAHLHELDLTLLERPSGPPLVPGR